MVIARGELWWADLAPTKGTEQSGRRPVLIVQMDKANSASPHTIIVPLTTKIRSRQLKSHVAVVAGDGGTTQDGVILCEQIRVIDKQRLQSRLGLLSDTRMSEVDVALKTILDLS